MAGYRRRASINSSKSSSKTAARAAVLPVDRKLVILNALERAGLALAFGAGDGVARDAEGAGLGCAASECAVIAAELRVVYARLRALSIDV